MSAQVRLLTEEESASIAEVSVDTIRKYRDCGLLDPIVQENKTFFHELDIRTLFYTKLRENNPLFVSRNKPSPEPEAASSYSAHNEVVHPSAPVETQVEVRPGSQNDQKLAVQPEVVDPSETKNTQAEEATSAPLPSSELIELNKSLRLQIQILREERDWLRDRIERLEMRSEREQMLLLSQNENVRNLIKTSNKSFWAKALPWFGK